MPSLISQSPATGVWLLTTPRTSYAVRIDETGSPCHVAWGPRLSTEEADALVEPAKEPPSSFEGRPTVGEELPVDGGTRYGPPSLQLRYADGSRGFAWLPTEHQVTQEGPTAELVLGFRDRLHPVHVALHYRVRADTDVIERWTVVRNAATARWSCCAPTRRRGPCPRSRTIASATSPGSGPPRPSCVGNRRRTAKRC